ncbi:HAMP domain-containing sensor histidine kinase [Parafrankia sp. EUN1f]|uniref:sensor histidine kinase n=1 Tax=Parafrankia sp. EUN1f TaxID=102897 RepID=UPI0001C46FFB|nr:HAMP domain-containing sensor histidine kinase [Parafrankia sp. EUN1f]EFC82614.1 histidine kinase [Parafrankia sp. EUN1f]
MRDGRRPAGLAARIALATTAVAVLAVALTGTIFAGLVGGAADDEARRALGRQADVVATLFARPNATADLRAGVARTIAAQRVTFVRVTADGRPITRQGPGAGHGLELPADVLTRIGAGQDVGAARTVGGRRVIVAARPLDGGGAIALVQPATENGELAGAMLRRFGVALAGGLAAATAVGLLLASRLARPLRRLAEVADQLAAGRRGRDPRAAVRPEHKASEHVASEHKASEHVAPERAGGPGWLGRPGWLGGPGRVGRPGRAVAETVTVRSGPAEVADVGAALDGLAAALAESEDRQRRFLLSVSHELRTPLTAVRGFAEALADGVTEPDDVTSTGRIILGEAQRLDRLVSDLLDLARLGADDFRVDLAEVDLRALMSEAAAVWRPRCEAAGVRLGVELPGAPVPARTDPMRFRQIVDGLAENALRVVPAGQPVVIALRADPVAAVIEVRDGGPGLTDDDLAVAFERSALFERYRGRRPVLTGVGLALVAGLTRRLGGTPFAGHAPEGGAAFGVSLPVGDDATATDHEGGVYAGDR